MGGRAPVSQQILDRGCSAVSPGSHAPERSARLRPPMEEDLGKPVDGQACGAWRACVSKSLATAMVTVSPAMRHDTAPGSIVLEVESQHHPRKATAHFAGSTVQALCATCSLALIAAEAHPAMWPWMRWMRAPVLALSQLHFLRRVLASMSLFLFGLKRNAAFAPEGHRSCLHQFSLGMWSCSQRA